MFTPWRVQPWRNNTCCNAAQPCAKPKPKLCDCCPGKYGENNQGNHNVCHHDEGSSNFNESRCERNGGYEPRCERNGGYEPRCERNGGYEPRCERNGSYEPRCERNGGYEPRCERNGGYELRCERNGGYEPRCERNGGYEPRCERSEPGWHYGEQNGKDRCFTSQNKPEAKPFCRGQSVDPEHKPFCRTQCTDAETKPFCRSQCAADPEIKPFCRSQCLADPEIKPFCRSQCSDAETKPFCRSQCVADPETKPFCRSQYAEPEPCTVDRKGGKSVNHSGKTVNPIAEPQGRCKRNQNDCDTCTGRGEPSGGTSYPSSAYRGSREKRLCLGQNPDISGRAQYTGDSERSQCRGDACEESGRPCRRTNEEVTSVPCGAMVSRDKQCSESPTLDRTMLGSQDSSHTESLLNGVKYHRLNLGNRSNCSQPAAEQTIERGERNKCGSCGKRPNSDRRYSGVAPKRYRGAKNK
ncbi:uncharacterized protein LOC103508678 [Diaphorina citri]|uniref:Uncharacterized protein LOC103508678 n=1 Tax=Diaphorina citri TaxID=121845 RepID=A0A1S3D082_DIACI|nr:uncharacterized protein LOC103508678 [Diaphorina citri]